jgi:hypothetical protein
MTGTRPPELDGPSLPECLAHVWVWFCELASARQGNGFSALPLSWSDLASWVHLTGEKPSPDEVRLLRRLDQLQLAHLDSPKPPPPKQPLSETDSAR